MKSMMNTTIFMLKIKKRKKFSFHSVAHWCTGSILPLSGLGQFDSAVATTGDLSAVGKGGL